MRACGAGTVGSISVRGKRTAAPISARSSDDADRVRYAVDASPSRPLSSTPPKSSRRRSRPSVLEDAPRCQQAATPVRGVTRRCASACAVVPTTRGRTGRVHRLPARASPLPLLNGADRGSSAAASTHRCEPTRPLPGRSAGDQAAPDPEGRLVGVHAGGAGSVGSISVRGKRTATPMSARRAADFDRVADALDPSPSTTQLRRRRRAADVVDEHSASGMPCVANQRQPLSGAPPAAAPLPVLSSPRHGYEQATCADSRHGRRPSPSSTGLTVAALPPQARIAASRPDPSWGGALVTRKRPPQNAGS